MPPSTTDADNPTNSDASADSTTTTDQNTSTDNQPAGDSDNLDASKSTDTTTTADDDNQSTDDTNNDSADDDTPALQFDDDIDDWAAKRKLPTPENDEQRVAYQEQRDQQREWTRERQAKKDASDLSKTLSDAKPDDANEDDDDDIDPLEKRQNELEAQLKQEKTTRLQSEFYTENKVTKEEAKAILDIMKEKFARPTTPEGKKKAFELWSSPDALPDLLDLAKAKVGQTSSDVVADEAARKERERIAKESQANSPGRGAKNQTDGDKTPEQQRLERFSTWD